MSTLLDLLGVALVCVMVWFIWPPLVAGVLGMSVLSASRVLDKRRERRAVPR